MFYYEKCESLIKKTCSRKSVTILSLKIPQEIKINWILFQHHPTQYNQDFNMMKTWT